MSRIDQVIQVNTSIEQCYKQLIRFDMYPEFLSGVQEVSQRGYPGVWHWVVTTPIGQSLQWDMELDGAKHHNNIISWHTVREADVSHSGAITLKSQGEQQTEVHLVVEYTARNEDADMQDSVKGSIKQGLQAFKDYVEKGLQVTTSSRSRNPETLDKM